MTTKPAPPPPPPAQAAVPTIQILSTKGYASNAGIKFMVYSPPHKGKTDLVRTLNNPLVLASEHGLSTLEKYNIPYTPLTTIDQVKNIISWIKQRQYVGKFNSIVLDSVSYLTVVVLSELRSDPVKYTANGQKHYGMLKELVTDLLDALFAADITVYVTAWEDVKYDAFGNVQSTYPYVEGKAIQLYLIHYFDLTAHLDWHTINVAQADGTTVATQMPFLQTVEANGKFARCRKQGLAPFEPADLGALITKLATLA